MYRSIFALALVLSACTAVDPAALMRLSALSPLDADPGAFRVVLHLPDGLDLPEGAATLTLTASRDGAVEQGQYKLARTRDQDALTFRVAEADLAALRALQARIRAWEEADPRGTKGSLSLAAHPCTTGQGPEPDASFHAGLVLEPGGAEVPLLRPVRVSHLDDRLRQDGGAGLLPCKPVP